MSFYKTMCQVACTVENGQSGPDFINSAMIEQSNTGVSFKAAKDGLVRHVKRNLEWLKADHPAAKKEIQSTQQLLDLLETFSEVGLNSNGTALLP